MLIQYIHRRFNEASKFMNIHRWVYSVIATNNGNKKQLQLIPDQDINKASS